jgi:murein L,D-transpeptidase YafK
MISLFVLVWCILFSQSVTISNAQTEVPSSTRSRRAIERAEPALKSALTKKGLQYGAPIFIRIVKIPPELEVWVRVRQIFRLFKTYRICTFGRGTIGPKLRKGDGQAPEGFYFVTPRRMNPLSAFHLSFNIGYPNAYDRAHGRTGGDIMVHGSCVSIGCYAMTDRKIEEIYALADAAFQNGQRFFRVHIFPFRMTNRHMRKHSDSPWIEFWRNLKEGYDFFNSALMPPNVRVRNSRYIFEPS